MPSLTRVNIPIRIYANGLNSMAILTGANDAAYGQDRGRLRLDMK